MQQLVKEKLCNLVSDYGKEVYQDTQKCSSLLLEYCPQYISEVNLLVTTLEETKVVNKLLNSSASIHKEVTLGQLHSQLQKELYITPKAASWVIETWAIALGIISPGKWHPSSDEVVHQFSDRTSEVLKTLIKNHGQLICTDSKKLRAYINDYSSNTSENKLLARVSQQGIIKQLISCQDKISFSLIQELAQQLENELFLTSQAAQWSIDTWTKALELKSEVMNSNSQHYYTSQPQQAKSSPVIPVDYKRQNIPTQQVEKTSNNTSKSNNPIIAVVSILGLLLLGGGFYLISTPSHHSEVNVNNAQEDSVKNNISIEQNNQSDLSQNKAKSSCGDRSIDISKTFYRVYVNNQGNNLEEIKQNHCQDAFTKGDRIQVASFQDYSQAANFTQQMKEIFGSAWQEEAVTKPSQNKKPADRFIRDYYNLFNNNSLHEAFNLQTTDFQNQKTGGYASYERWRNSLNEARVIETNILEENNINARVKVKLQFIKKDNTSWSSSYIFGLTWDESINNWKINETIKVK
ncbi:MAG: hypothetical protein Tsb0014_04860 [Pleurocapsa sp.]